MLDQLHKIYKKEFTFVTVRNFTEIKEITSTDIKQVEQGMFCILGFLIKAIWIT